MFRDALLALIGCSNYLEGIHTKFQVSVNLLAFESYIFVQTWSKKCLKMYMEFEFVCGGRDPNGSG